MTTENYTMTQAVKDLVIFKKKYCFLKCEGVWQYRVGDVEKKDLPVIDRLKENGLVTKFSILGNITDRGLEKLGLK